MGNEILTLSKGDIIDIVAPSGKGNKYDLSKVSEYVKSLNLVPRIDNSIYSDKDIFYANSNHYRANAFKEALIAEDSKALWCIRGGKGATEIIPYLEGKMEGFEPLKKNIPNKLLIGFSDITALHLFLEKKYGCQSIHGAMLEQIVNNYPSEESVKILTDIIFNNINSTTYPVTTKINGETNLNIIEGKITGGNLTLVEKSLATDWQIDTEDKIIFLEDVNGAAYEVERSLTHLSQAGIFQKANAVILCDFIKLINENLIPETIKRFADKVKIPTFHMKGIGHSKINKPILYGLNYIIKSEDLSLSTSWLRKKKR